MRIWLRSLFITSPFEALLEHAEKIKECGWVFQQAVECYVSDQCEEFETLRQEVSKLENEADAIKRRIRGHIPKGTWMPVTKFELFLYIREQDKVLDSVQDALDWISLRPKPTIQEQLQKDLFLLVDSVIEPMEDLSRMISEAKKYFDSYSEKQRRIVKDIIHNLRKREHEADKIEDELKLKLFTIEKDPITVFHTVRLSEIIGSIADHAENSGDMMRAMIARKGKPGLLAKLGRKGQGNGVTD
ncbi:MAG: TIGR00153 family protein [Deltaproteobacteria bacterium]|nr:TIGR00153 family protein [Deltaproteobacteria bacterium]